MIPILQETKTGEVHLGEFWLYYSPTPDESVKSQGKIFAFAVVY